MVTVTAQRGSEVSFSGSIQGPSGRFTSQPSVENLI